MSNEKLYMIKRGEVYSRGGSWPTWSKRGRVWRGTGPLRNHLNNVSKGREYDDQCELVEIEITKLESSTPLSYFLNLSAEAKKAKEETRQISYEKYQAEERRKIYDKLRKEFEGS